MSNVKEFYPSFVYIRGCLRAEIIFTARYASLAFCCFEVVCFAILFFDALIVPNVPDVDGLYHLAASILGQLVLLLAEASLLDLASLVVVAGEAVLLSEVVNALGIELRKLLSGVDIGHLLDVALGEDQVDLLQGPTGGLGVEEVQDGEEDCVEGGEEEVGTPTDILNEHWRDHDNEEVPNLDRAVSTSS